MGLCRHNHSQLVLEADLTPGLPADAGVDAGIPGKIQLFQCRHCGAVRAHTLRDDRVAVGPWKQLPYPHLPVANQVLLLASAAALAPFSPARAEEVPAVPGSAPAGQVIRLPRDYWKIGAGAYPSFPQGVR